MTFWRVVLTAALPWVVLLVAMAATFGAELRPARAIDGDTLVVDGEVVRVMGLDAPELRGARCDAELRLAQAATTRMAALVLGGVTIETAPRRDRYGRVLAVVRDAGGRDVAAVMVREGLARAYQGRERAGWCG